MQKWGEIKISLLPVLGAVHRLVGRRRGGRVRDMNGLLLSNHLTSVRFSWVDPCPPLMDGQQCFRHKRKQHKPISSSSWRRPEPVNPTSASLTVLFNTNEICYVGNINKIIYVELLLFLFGQSAKVQSVHSATVVKTNVSGQSHCSSN